MSESDEWAVVEIFGRIRVAGRVSEADRYGVKLLRVDIPRPDGGFGTQLYGGTAIFRLTPVSEEIARAVAAQSQPEPVHRWELPAVRMRDPEEELSQAAEYEENDEGGVYGGPF